jgi:TetR/AcrR family transcriptional repressor of nem operon
VSAAYRVIAERGFEGLRTREVAGEVGVNIATLHYYFPSKEDLIKGVIGHAMTRFQTTLSSTGTASQRLRAHFQGLRRLSHDEPELFKVMGELMLRSSRDPKLGETVRKTMEYWHGTLRTLLRGAKEERAISEAIDPDGMSAVIVATLRGVYLLPGSSSATDGLDKALRQLERILGLAPKKGPASASGSRG